MLEPSDTPTVDAPIDRFPVADLPGRYAIKAAALYKRLEAVAITPLKLGKHSFVTGTQLQVMDDLHLHLRRGGGLADFSRPNWLAEDVSAASERESGLVHQTSGSPTQSHQEGRLESHVTTSLLDYLVSLNLSELLTSSFVKAGQVLFPPPLPPARRGLQLAYLRELQEAAAEGWWLTTHDVASLLGVSKSTITARGQQFSTAGFVFTRAGKGIGGQIAWKVSKDSGS